MANYSDFDGNLSVLMSHYNSTFGEEEIYNVPPGIVALLAVLYGSVSIVAILGNGLVILVIAKNRKMQTVTNIFIANLAFADVIIGLFSTPFQFQPALHQRWDLPKFLCKVAPSVKVLSVSVSVFTLGLVAIDRYIAVLYPFKPGFSKHSAFLGITLVWIVGIASSTPEAMYFSFEYMFDATNGNSKPYCNILWPTENFGKYYHLYLFIVQYLLPLFVINFSYIRIACRIWGTKQPGHATETDNVRQRNKRKVVKMLIVVVCLFVLCWMPLQIYGFLSEVYTEINDYKYINIIWFCSNWLAMSNSCYNPFIYGLLNEKFKYEYRLLFSKSPCLRRLAGEPRSYYRGMVRDGNAMFYGYKYINIIWFCSNWLAMSNSCYNPFIYGLLNEKFKHAYRLLFSKSPCLRKLAGEPRSYYRGMVRDGNAMFYGSDTLLHKSMRVQNGFHSTRCTSVRSSDRCRSLSDLTSQTAF